MAYLGPQGVNVWIVRIGPESDNTYLICIRGIDSIWDNYVIYSRRDRVRGKERYVALIKGKPTIIMRVKDDKGWVYIPEENGKSLLVEYSDERSKKFYPDYFIRSYLYQVK